MDLYPRSLNLCRSGTDCLTVQLPGAPWRVSSHPLHLMEWLSLFYEEPCPEEKKVNRRVKEGARRPGESLEEELRGGRRWEEEVAGGRGVGVGEDVGAKTINGFPGSRIKDRGVGGWGGGRDKWTSISESGY